MVNVEFGKVLIYWYYFQGVDVDMFWQGGDLLDCFGYIFWCQCLGIFVSFFGFSVIVFKVDVRKFGVVYQIWFDVGYVYCGVVQVGMKIEVKLMDKGFGCFIDVFVGVRLVVCCRVDIDDMVVIVFYYFWQYGVGYVYQFFIIGVDYIFLVFYIGVVCWFQIKCQVGVVYQYIDSLLFGWQVSNQCFNGGVVVDVKLCDIKVIVQFVFQCFQVFFMMIGGNYFMIVSDKMVSNIFIKIGGGVGDYDNYFIVF